MLALRDVKGIQKVQFLARRYCFAVTDLPDDRVGNLNSLLVALTRFRIPEQIFQGLKFEAAVDIQMFWLELKFGLERNAVRPSSVESFATWSESSLVRKGTKAADGAYRG